MTKMHSNTNIYAAESIDRQVIWGDIRRGLARFWWLGVIISLLLGGFQFCRQIIGYIPIYTCSTTFMLQIEDSSADHDSAAPTYSFAYSLATKHQLSEVFTCVLESDLVRQMVCTDLGVEEMPVSVKVSGVDNSNLITLTAAGEDAALTHAALASIIEHYTVIADFILGETQLILLESPALPVSPANAHDWIAAVLGGIMLGVLLTACLLIVYAFLRSTVRTKDDIRLKLGQPCLAVLPQAVALYRDPAFLDAMQLIRRRLGQTQVVMITATAPGEGSSTVTRSLAAMLAQNGDSVLILDYDLRSSAKDIPFIPRPTDTPGLDLLTFPADLDLPRQVLHPDRLSALLAPLRKAYHYILIDAPPCGVITDTAAMAAAADGVLYIIRQDTVLFDSVRAGLDAVCASGAPLLGCILNRAAIGWRGYGETCRKHKKIHVKSRPEASNGT